MSLIVAMDVLRISSRTPTRSKPYCSSDWVGEEKVAYRFKIVAAKGTSRVDGFYPLMQDVYGWQRVGCHPL